MKKSLFSGVALAAVMAFGGSGWADVVVGIGVPGPGRNGVYG
ncbi:branched chain amino acid ABC transporter substrate-binding protein, partial [Brucella oryzae]